jgi:hypothetical protein
LDRIGNLLPEERRIIEQSLRAKDEQIGHSIKTFVTAQRSLRRPKVLWANLSYSDWQETSIAVMLDFSSNCCKMQTIIALPSHGNTTNYHLFHLTSIPIVSL